ncbi:MAG: hypothetical protein AB8B74_05150 [Crocinitomicaceae bacterium]
MKKVLMTLALVAFIGGTSTALAQDDKKKETTKTTTKKAACSSKKACCAKKGDAKKCAPKAAVKSTSKAEM